MTTETTPAPRITRIEVTALFGLYDHVIDLNLEDRVTILHGPNGVGKTTLLLLVHALVTDEFTRLLDVPFKNLTLVTSDDIRFVATPSQEIITQGPKRRPSERHVWQVELSATRGVSPISEPSVFQYTDKEDGLGAAFSKLLFPAQTSPAEAVPRWFPGDSDRTAVVEELEKLRAFLTPADRLSRSIAAIDDPTSPTPSVISQHAAALQRRIADDWVRFGELSQQLDRSYLSRLLQPGAFHEDQVETLKPRMRAIEAKRDVLRSIGLVDDDDRLARLDIPEPLPSDQLRAMSIYVADSEQKLAHLDPLATRLALLLRIANARFRNKTVRADLQHGLVVTTHDGRPLALDALSSGEQHQIILLHDLLFRVPANTLVLIDEPELSLHVLWQKRFLPDLLEIVKVVGIDALIATHSPSIVGDRSDLMVRARRGDRS